MQETRGWEWGDCRGSDTRRLALPIWGRAHMGFRPIWASVWFLGRREGSAYMSRSTSHLTLTLFHSAACHYRNTKIQQQQKYNKKNTKTQRGTQCVCLAEPCTLLFSPLFLASAVHWVQCSAEIEMLSVLAMPHTIWKWTHRLCTINIPVSHLVQKKISL